MIGLISAAYALGDLGGMLTDDGRGWTQTYIWDGNASDLMQSAENTERYVLSQNSKYLPSLAMTDVRDAEIEAKVQAGLQGTPFEVSSVRRLPTGIVNWGYHGVLRHALEDGTAEVFLKHGEVFLAKIENYEVPLLRCVRYNFRKIEVD
jgi:hypothetical protein